MLASFKRVIKSGFLSFKRNFSLNISTIFVVFLAVSLVSFIFFLNLFSRILISDIEKRVDISVYFKEDAPSEKILSIKDEISKLEDVEKIEYVSADETMEKFIEKYKNDETIMESLKEIEKNPFYPSLNINAKTAQGYENIVNYLNKSVPQELIAKIDYFERKPVIDKIFSITSTVNKGGLVFGILFSIIAILAGFNTKKIAIENLKQEIETMRLVGASNWFIRGPFLVQGIIIGFFAILLSLIMIFILFGYFDGKIKSIEPSFSLMSLLFDNFGKLILLQLIVGVGLGIIASSFAIRKYLKV